MSELALLSWRCDGATKGLVFARSVIIPRQGKIDLRRLWRETLGSMSESLEMKLTERE